MKSSLATRQKIEFDRVPRRSLQEEDDGERVECMDHTIDLA